jgi:hypothetical protein
MFMNRLYQNILPKFLRAVDIRVEIFGKGKFGILEKGGKYVTNSSKLLELCRN